MDQPSVPTEVKTLFLSLASGWSEIRPAEDRFWPDRDKTTKRRLSLSLVWGLVLNTHPGVPLLL